MLWEMDISNGQKPSSIGSASSSDDVQPPERPAVFLLEEATSFKADRNSSASIESPIQSLKQCPTGDKDPATKIQTIR